jgi:hypothetical protein
VVLVATALASGLAGAALDRALVEGSTSIQPDTGFHPLSSALRMPTEEDRARIRDELSTSLSLTPDQNRAIDSIMSRRSVEFDGLRESIRPRVEGLLSNVRADIERVLTPEQRDRYRKLQSPSTMADTTDGQQH